MCTATASQLAGMDNDMLYQKQLQAEQFQSTNRYDSRSGKQIYAAVPKDQLAQAPNSYRDELQKRGDAINAASAADRAAFDADRAEQERILAARAEQLRNEQLGRTAQLAEQERGNAMEISIAMDAARNARNGAIAPSARESKAPTAGMSSGRRRKRGGDRSAGPSLRVGDGAGLNIGV